jgi:hypothetical protein
MSVSRLVWDQGDDCVFSAGSDGNLYGYKSFHPFYFLFLMYTTVSILMVIFFTHSKVGTKVRVSAGCSEQYSWNILCGRRNG